MKLSRFCSFTVLLISATNVVADERPNVLVMISDDVSYPHASAYGSKMVSTPAFDRVASDGVLFHNAFCPAPGCSPSRAAFLTGRHIWMIEEAGTHASYFKTKYQTFPERLEESGYFAGSVGKAWGPGNYRRNGRTENPAGKSYGGKGQSYVDGFKKFLKARPKDQPFCFWFGSTDAHRSYEKGSGLAKGKTLQQAEVPGFLPDAPEIRSDLLDYAFEVERFDDDCDMMLKALADIGELDNTLIIITSDNGMPFPRAKANCYEFGVHMPLAVRWGKQIPSGRNSRDLINFIDLTATIYDATGVAPPTTSAPVGKSLLTELKSTADGMLDEGRANVVVGRERHSSSRFNTLSYPQRALRTHDFLYIYNFKSERWPAGPGMKYDKATYDKDGKVVTAKEGNPHGGYHDIDACPSLTFLINHRDHPEFGKYLGLSTDRRPAEELFDIRVDPDCLNNLAASPEHAETRQSMHDELMNQLKATGDARVLDGGDVWETYPRVSGLRWFPAPQWAKDAPTLVPVAEWLEKKRPQAK